MEWNKAAIDRIAAVRLAKGDRRRAGDLVRKEVRAFIERGRPTIEDLYVFALQKLYLAERTAKHLRTWRRFYGPAAIADAEFQHKAWHQVTRRLTKLVEK